MKNFIFWLFFLFSSLGYSLEIELYELRTSNLSFSTGDQCLDYSLELIHEELGVELFEYRISKNSSFKSQNWKNWFSSHPVVKKIKIKPTKCNTNFTFYFRLKSEKDCANSTVDGFESGRIEFERTNVYRNSCFY